MLWEKGSSFSGDKVPSRTEWALKRHEGGESIPLTTESGRRAGRTEMAS